MIDDKLKQDIDKCTLCGVCLASCPTYQTELNEQHSCRGRMSLAKGIAHSNGFKNYPLVMDIMDSCIFCGKCNDVCPEKIKPLNIIINVIHDTNITSKNIFNFKNMLKNIERKTLNKDLIFFILSKQKLLKILKLDNLLFKFLGFPSKREILPLAPQNFYHIKQRNQMEGYPQKKVIMFLGCLGKYVFPKIIHKVIGILRKKNIQVVIPREQTCCGYFNISNRNLQVGLKQLTHCNSYLNSKSDNSTAIITLCDSCQRMLSGNVVNLKKNKNLKLPIYTISQYFKKFNILLDASELRLFKKESISNIGESGLFKIDNFEYVEKISKETKKSVCSDLMVYYLLKSSSNLIEEKNIKYFTEIMNV